MNKPVTPAAHGVIDYIFSGIQLAVPVLIGMNNKAAKTYGVLGAGFTAINALTDTPAGIKRSISFKGHQKADIGFLAGISLLTFSNFIRKDKKAFAFHLGFLTVAVAHYLLTDYKAGSK